MQLDFKHSANLTLGVELELQLINLNNYNLSQNAEELLQRLRTIEIPGKVKPEITRGMIEMNSSIHTHPDTLAQELKIIKNILNEEAHKMNIGLAGGGTHSFQNWKDQKIFPTKRFENLLHMYGYLTKLFTVFSQHIHLGCISGDQSIKLCHGFARYIPQLIALSASSPFYQEADSDFDACRPHIISAFPTSGTIPKFFTWAEFEKYYYQLVDLQIIGSIKDLYWDIRPKPEFGTVEIRICDTPLQIQKAVELAAYAQAIACYLLDAPAPESLEQVYVAYNYNKFQATKFGFDGEIIDPQSKSKIKLQDDILMTLDKIAPYVKELNINQYLERIKHYASTCTNDAKLLRALHNKPRTFAQLVQKQTEMMAED